VLRHDAPSRLVLSAVVAFALCAPPSGAQPIADLDRVLHVLNRTTFGPRDATVDQIITGAGTLDAKLNAFLDGQLGMSVPPLVENQSLAANLATLSLATGGQGSPGTYKDLQKSILLRAAFAELQLRELMTLFWDRHFNTAAFVVESGLYQVGAAAESYTVHFERAESDFFRTNAFADFRDLLDYSAKHIPMLIYLNGVSNVAGAVNENYAREVLELFTMGPASVSGVLNYDQADIQNVAKLLTGWQIPFDPSTQQYSVVADDSKHTTFGQSVTLFAVSGSPATLVPATTAPRLVQDTNALFDLLAARDATRDFMVRKLLAFFYNDGDATATTGTVQTIINRAKLAWGDRGNILGVLNVILRHASFLDGSKRWTRLKSPVEQIVSLPRVAGAAAFNSSHPNGSVPSALEIAWLAMNRTAERLFFFPSPDGYPIASDEQLGSQSYLDRVTFTKVVYDEWSTFGVFLANHDYVPALVAFFNDLGPNYKQSAVVAPYLLARFFGTAATSAELSLVTQALDTTSTGAVSPLSQVPNDVVWANRVLTAVALIGGLPRASAK
jgi:uncharacterized protein (DUF1800 family)